MASLLSTERYARYYQGLSLIYQKPEIKASLEVILSVFMVTILIFVAIKPTLTNVAGLQKKITDQETLSLKADKKIGQLFSAQAQLTQYQDKIALFDKAVGNKLSYFDMMSRIELIARKNNITIDSVSAPGSIIAGTGKGAGDWSTRLATKDTNGVTTVNVNITFYGGPKEIRKFLTEIENIDVLTMIKNVVLLKESGGAKGTQRIKATMTVYFYFLATTNET